MVYIIYALAAACLVYAGFTFQGKGPLLATIALVATKEEKESIKTLGFTRIRK